MADAFQCDRCGDLCKGTPSKRVTSTVPIANNLVSGLKVSPFEGNEGKELCAECATEFDRFMDGADVAPEDAIGWMTAASVEREAPSDAQSVGYDNGGSGSGATYGDSAFGCPVTLTFGGSNETYNTKDESEPETPDYFEAGGRNY